MILFGMEKAVDLLAHVARKTTLHWFCATLPQMTADDLEIRLCRDSDSNDEDIIISLIEIYVAI